MRFNSIATLVAVTACFLAIECACAADAEKTNASSASAKWTAEWTQWGGSAARNNTPEGHNIPVEWNIGEFDYRTGEWKPQGSKNIKWVARLGSQTYGNTVVAGGHAYIGTNNSGGWLKRFPPDHDLGCLLCFDIKDGKFLWQHSSESCRPAACTIGRCKVCAAPRSWRATACTLSPIAVRSAAWIQKASTTGKTTAK